MLLRSRPDTVHRFLLRKTQTSTSLIKGSFTAKQPRFGITPAVADCRYRAPLSPRLRGILTILTFLAFVNLCVLYRYYSIPISEILRTYHRAINCFKVFKPKTGSNALILRHHPPRHSQHIASVRFPCQKQMAIFVKSLHQKTIAPHRPLSLPQP